jgi:hypothetical protein
MKGASWLSTAHGFNAIRNHRLRFGSAIREFLAFTTATGLSRYIDIKWPKGLAPTPAKSIKRSSSDPLPAADVLVVTWTVDEGHALSRVLTPGKDSHNDYLPYTNNFAMISKKMRNGCPALEAMRLGSYWTTTIGKKSVVVFKSESQVQRGGGTCEAWWRAARTRFYFLSPRCGERACPRPDPGVRLPPGPAQSGRPDDKLRNPGEGAWLLV